MDTKNQKSKIKQYFQKNESLSIISGCLLICLLIFVILTVIFLSGYENALQGIQEKQISYNNLEDEFTNLNSQYDNLKRRYDNLQDEINDYKDQQNLIDNLNNELLELQKNYDQLSAENADLKEQISELENNNDSGSGWHLPSAVSSSNQTSGYSDSGGEMVWLSETGSKYHSIPDCGKMNPNRARQVTKESAEAQGYDACSKCW